MISRRQFGMYTVGATLGVTTAGHAGEQQKLIEPELSDDGLYYQKWFVNSFLDLGEDLAEAQQAGKRFAIFWEQKGCPYCKETHLVNFGKPKINQYVRENFAILQLNMWGSREVTDFDGQAMEERKLARKWGITFTPTIMFLEESVEKVAGRPGNKAEVARMPGYFKPFHFINMFQYVKEKSYAQQHFQKYIQEKAERMRKDGKQVELW